MDYKYILSLHLIFVVCWFAGLFYIVRLFIYTKEAFEKQEPEKSILTKQLLLMQRKLWYIITWPAAILAVIFGSWMLIENTVLLMQPWMWLKLIFVGSTTDNQQHIINELNSKIQKYQIEKNVKIIPFQSNINTIWKAIDIAVVPSIEPEPFGLVAVEAMLASKPVVASNHGGLTEIIDHQQTGFLIEPNNIQELINAIEKLINDKKLRLDMGQKGYKRAAEEFSIQKHVSKIEKVLAD